jgi:hypothetical protein
VPLIESWITFSRPDSLAKILGLSKALCLAEAFHFTVIRDGTGTIQRLSNGSGEALAGGSVSRKATTGPHAVSRAFFGRPATTTTSVFL